MNAIGIIETRGLAAAVEAADTAVKSADAELLGYELSRGAGQITVKLEGDVSAITAAVEAGAQAASKVNQVVATLVMGRPHEDIHPLIYSSAMVGLVPTAAETEAEDVCEEPEAEDPSETDPEQAEAEAEVQKATCNLCGDPQCPRIKGDPHQNCIHFSGN